MNIRLVSPSSATFLHLATESARRVNSYVRIILASALLLLGSGSARAQVNLQSLIDSTPVGGTLYLQGIVYPVTTTLVISHPITIMGTGYATFITGDPGNAPLVTVNQTTGVVFDAIRFRNTHVAAAGEISYVNIWFDRSTQSSVVGCWFTGGRTATDMTGSSHISVTSNVMDALFDVAVAANGNSSYLTISHNHISNTVTSTDPGPPHDINLEDASNSQVTNNLIIESPTGFTQLESSGIQVATNHNPSLQNVNISGNVLRHSVGGTANVGIIVSGHPSVTFNNVQVTNNVITDFATGIQYGEAVPNGVLIYGNQIEGFYKTGIYATSSMDGNGASIAATNFQINSNHLVGVAGKGGGSGIRLVLWKNLQVGDNHTELSGGSGISLEGVVSSTVSGSVVYDNSQETPATYDGIAVLPSPGGTVVSSGNLISSSMAYDDETTPRQLYGIYIAKGSLDNTISGVQAWGNIGGAVKDLGTGTKLN